MIEDKRKEIISKAIEPKVLNFLRKYSKSLIIHPPPIYKSYLDMNEYKVSILGLP